MSINISETIWTIINFLLLMFLLKIFLYKPLLKFMDAQKSRIKEGLAEGEKAREAKEENAKQLASDLQKSNNEAKRILSEAKAADERAKTAAIGKANERAASIRSSVAERIANEEQADSELVEESLTELVALLTSKLLGISKPVG